MQIQKRSTTNKNYTHQQDMKHLHNKDTSIARFPKVGIGRKHKKGKIPIRQMHQKKSQNMISAIPKSILYNQVQC